ncbi:MAG: TerC family protein [Cytophagales bacterium]
MLEELFTGKALISLLSLTLLEIVLGIDNVIFISILAGKLPAKDQAKARNLGISLSLVTRILLLLGISWIIGLKQTLFTIFDLDISGKDLILLCGGLFLIAKSTTEIHGKLEGESFAKSTQKQGVVSFRSVIVQIILLDMVFSFDSILTAVGIADQILVMIVAIGIAMAIMLGFSKPISDFIARHPTMKMLALSFLILIGVLLVVESLHAHIDKGYVYFAMAFALGVETLNLNLRKKSTAVQIK